MNKDRFTGIFKQLKGTIQEGWGNLTHNPLVITAGEREQLDGRRQERYGASEEQAARQLKEFRERNRKWDLTSR